MENKILNYEFRIMNNMVKSKTMAMIERNRLNYKDLLKATGDPVDPDKAEDLFYIREALSGITSGSTTLPEKEVKELRRKFKEAGLDPDKI